MNVFYSGRKNWKTDVTHYLLWKHQTFQLTKKPSVEGWNYRQLDCWVNTLYNKISSLISWYSWLLLYRALWLLWFTGINGLLLNHQCLRLQYHWYHINILLYVINNISKYRNQSNCYHWKFSFNGNSFISTNIFQSIKVSCYYGISFMNGINFPNKFTPCAIYHIMNVMAYIMCRKWRTRVKFLRLYQISIRYMESCGCTMVR